jgi:hypothetical protein
MDKDLKQNLAATRAKSRLLLMIAVFTNFACCAEGVIGSWQTETNRLNELRGTNEVQWFEIVEFRKDGTFRMTDFLLLNGAWRTNVPFTGSYTMTSSNQASLKLKAANLPSPSGSPQVVVPCSLEGDVLLIPKLVTSVVPESPRYRKLK